MKKAILLLFMFCIFNSEIKAQWSQIDSFPASDDCIGAPFLQKFIFASDSTIIWYHSYLNCSPSTFPGFEAYFTSDQFASKQTLVSCNPCTDPAFTFFYPDTILEQFDYWSADYYCNMSTDGGITWSTVVGPVHSNQVRLFFINSSNGYGFDGNTFLKFQNDSLYHLNPVVNFTINLNQMEFKHNGEGCVMISNSNGGTGKRIIKTLNEGVTWNISFYDTIRTLYSMQFFDDSSGVLIADSGYVYKTTDYGTNWSLLFHDTSSSYLKFNSLSELYYVKNYSTTHHELFYSTDTGLTWSHQLLPTKCNSYQAYLFESGVGYLRGVGSPFQTNYIYKTSNYLTTIKPSSQQSNKLLIAPNPTMFNTTVFIPNDLNGNSIFITIYDLMGNQIHKKSYRSSGGEIILDLKSFDKGLFSVVVSDGEKSYYGKLILN